MKTGSNPLVDNHGVLNIWGDIILVGGIFLVALLIGFLVSRRR